MVTTLARDRAHRDGPGESDIIHESVCHHCCQEEILPAVLEFSDDTEEEFLAAVITHLEPTMTTFKLAPAYILYMATR